MKPVLAARSLRKSSLYHRIFLYMLLVALGFAALELFILAYRPPRGALLPERQVTVLRDGALLGTMSLPLLISSGSDPDFVMGEYSFILKLPLTEITAGKGRKNLVFPQVSGSSLEVFFDGEKLGTRGDPVAGQSSIWNSVHQFSVSGGLDPGEHYIEARIQGTYEAGIVTMPYLVDADTQALRLFLLAFLTNYSIWLSIGCILIVSLIVLSMGIFSEKSGSANLLLGLAGIAVSIFLTDFVYIERLPFSLVAFKKLVVSLRHLSVAFFTIAYLRLLGKRLSVAAKIFTAVQLTCFVIVVVYPGNIVDIKRLYSLTFLAFLPSLLYLLYKVIRHSAETGTLSTLLFGIVVVFLSAGRDIVVMVLLRPDGLILISHYGFIVLALASGVFVVKDSLGQYKALALERSRSAAFREESLRDELTGCHNRKLLSLVAETLIKPYSLIMFDIDDFKRINDTWGHEAGDRVLIDLVRLAGRNIRSYDYVVRTGGDEFLIILRSCPIKVACFLAERLVNEAATLRILPSEARAPQIVNPELGASEGQKISFSISVGLASCAGEGPPTQDDFSATLRKADAEMYRAKNSGKNRWSAAESEGIAKLVQNERGR